MARVNISSIWGSAPTYLTDPGGAKVATGWVNEAGIANWDNWHKNRTDQFLEEVERRGISIYSAGTVYHKGGLAMGSNDDLYQAEIINPGMDPVGAPVGNWHRVHGPMAYKMTVFLVSDPAWVPESGAHSIRMTATAGGGAGGGVPNGGAGTATSIAGAGGGTAIHTYDHTNGTTYNITVAGVSVGVVAAAGNAGVNTSVTDGVVEITALGGAGGTLGSGGGADLPGVLGGAATVADVLLDGGSSNSGGDGAIGGYSHSGGSYWAPGIASTVDGSTGISAGVGQVGVGGGAVGGGTSQMAGGDGGQGCVLAEEFF